MATATEAMERQLIRVEASFRVPHRLRVQRRRVKGQTGLPDGAVYVGRPSKWGNPFTPASAIEVGYARDEDEARSFCVQCFAEWLTLWHQQWYVGEKSDRQRSAILDSIGVLYGKPLACWCPLNRPCHADVLAALANDFC